MEQLKDPNISSLFEANVGGKFAAINMIENGINTITDNIKKYFMEQQ